MEIKMNLTEEQLRIVVRSLDLYSRLSCGQWRELDRISSSSIYENLSDSYDAILKARDFAFSDLKQFNSLDAANGITHPDTSKNAKIAYEIQGIISHELWKLNNTSQMYSVDAYPPLELSGEPIPKVEIKVEAVIKDV